MLLLAKALFEKQINAKSVFLLMAYDGNHNDASIIITESN